MNKNRQNLLHLIWEAQDTAYDLMCEYDQLPHPYGDHVLYQAEAHVISLIATQPNITITDISNILRKTPSACSQIVRKLRAKGWVEQQRNEENNRVYNLRLTDEGMEVFRAHSAFDAEGQKRTFRRLEEFTDEELEHHLAVQEELIAAYQEDVRISREYFRKPAPENK